MEGETLVTCTLGAQCAFIFQANALLTNLSVRSARSNCLVHQGGTLQVHRCWLECMPHPLEHLFAPIVFQPEDQGPGVHAAAPASSARQETWALPQPVERGPLRASMAREGEASEEALEALLEELWVQGEQQLTQRTGAGAGCAWQDGISVAVGASSYLPRRERGGALLGQRRQSEGAGNCAKRPAQGQGIEEMSRLDGSSKRHKGRQRAPGAEASQLVSWAREGCADGARLFHSSSADPKTPPPAGPGDKGGGGEQRRGENVPASGPHGLQVAETFISGGARAVVAASDVVLNEVSAPALCWLQLFAKAAAWVIMVVRIVGAEGHSSPVRGRCRVVAALGEWSECWMARARFWSTTPWHVPLIITSLQLEPSFLNASVSFFPVRRSGFCTPRQL